MKTMLKIIASLIGLLVVLAAGASFHPEVQNVLRALSPSTDYDSEPPSLPPDLAAPAVLVFTKTNGFRHSEAIDEGLKFFEALSERRGWSMFHTENSAVFSPDGLSRFNVVVWHNASGAPLDADQRQALKAWILDGGGFVGIHAATDDSHHGWEWYQRELVGARFIGHTMGPQFQEAAIKVEQPEHQAMQGLAPSWSHNEEWYSFDASVRGQPGVEVLATVDEATYTPRLNFLWTDRNLAMGDHPIIWIRQAGEGRAFLTVLGHSAAAYQSQRYQRILDGAVGWAGRLRDK